MNNEDAIAILENLKTQGECFFSRRLALDLAIKALEERPTGHWIEGTQGYYCSECEAIDQFYFDHTFCGKCGADMRKEAENG
jgi:NADH pyrophosphatase NudC (nudix superfamily)